MTPDASMAGNVRGIDHIGITVPDVEAATRFLGSGLIGHSQKMTVAASATAEKKTVGQRS